MTQHLPTEDETRRLAEEEELEIEQDNALSDLNERETLEDAENAIREMEARERRRDGQYDTGGDDYSPGIDTDIGGNAPKEANRD